MASRYRPRRQFKFLLYQDLEMELILTDFILKLKQSRQFVTTIKNALRLMGSLMERDLSVLYELFPWIKEAIQADNPPPAPSAPDSGDLQRVITSAVAQGVQQAMLELPAPPPGYPLMKESRGTVGQGATFSAPPSEDEDDGDTVVITKTGTTKTPNFIDQMLDLMDSNKTFGGKNLTADENAKALAARRLS